MDGIRKHAVRIQNSSTIILGVLEVSLKRPPSTISLLNSRLAAVITLTFLFPFLFLSLGFNMASNTIRTEIPTPSTFVLPRYLTGCEARQILWEISKNMEQFLQAETVSAIGLGIFASLILLLALRSTSGLHRGKELRSNDLSHKIKALWTRPLITFFLIILLIIAYFLFALFLIISAAIFGSGCVYLVVLANTVVLVFFYSHIANIWISVMEDDLIGKEEKGRKLEGVTLMVILAVSVINPARLFINKSGENETFIRSSAGIGIGILGFFHLVKLIGFAVYAVFLHECKKAKEEQVEIVEKQDNTLITNKEV